MTRLLKKAIPEDVFALLHKLMVDQILNRFYLVGGTALAMQIGHRISIDIDLFTNEDFNADQMSDHLYTVYSARDMEAERNTVRAVINRVKVDLITHRYPLIEPFEETDSMRIASLKDIAAMKINAIAGRGSKKDFWDLSSLLDFFSIQDMISFFQIKYVNANVWHAEKSLSYFDDAEGDPDPNDITGRTWNDIKLRISRSLLNLRK